MSTLGPLLDEDDLAELREAVEETLQDRCVIADYGTVAQPSGSFADVWVDRPDDVACRLEPLIEREGRGKTAEYGSQTIGRPQGILNLPTGTPIKQNDRVRITTGRFADRRYRVVTEYAMEGSDWDASRRVIVEPLP